MDIKGEGEADNKQLPECSNVIRFGYLLLLKITHTFHQQPLSQLIKSNNKHNDNIHFALFSNFSIVFHLSYCSRLFSLKIKIYQVDLVW